MLSYEKAIISHSSYCPYAQPDSDQIGIAQQISVNLYCGCSSFGNGMHHQRLTPMHVAGSIAGPDLPLSDLHQVIIQSLLSLPGHAAAG